MKPARHQVCKGIKSIVIAGHRARQRAPGDKLRKIFLAPNVALVAGNDEAGWFYPPQF
jgi:hypothetical protein